MSNSIGLSFPWFYLTTAKKIIPKHTAKKSKSLENGNLTLNKLQILGCRNHIKPDPSETMSKSAELLTLEKTKWP